MCECLPGKTTDRYGAVTVVVCMEVVQPKGTCPLSCDDHTTIGARPILLDECLEDGDHHVKYSVGNGHVNPVYYSDNSCKTEADMPSPQSPIPGGCQDDFKEYLTLPGSTPSPAATPAAATPAPAPAAATVVEGGASSTLSTCALTLMVSLFVMAALC